MARTPPAARRHRRAALGTGGRVDALTVHAGMFADWRLGAGEGWGLAESVPVSIP